MTGTRDVNATVVRTGVTRTDGPMVGKRDHSHAVTQPASRAPHYLITSSPRVTAQGDHPQPAQPAGPTGRSRAVQTPEIAENAPTGLAGGGTELWTAVTAQYSLDEMQRSLLLEACRCKDRLDRLDALIRGERSEWLDTPGMRLVIKDPNHQSNMTADSLKQLLAAMRLPDATGRRPQRRGGARGFYRA